MKKVLLKLFLLFELFIVFPLQSQNYSIKEVEAVLVKSGKNRSELEKAIRYFKKKNDPLQLKAAYFLISNMDIHASANYYWADSLGKQIPFNELVYKDLESSVEAFEALKAIHGKLHPVAVKYKDIDSIKGDFLIDNIEQAFISWKKSPLKNLSFKDFCEYVLPYRISIEPLQQWRGIYGQRYKWMADNIKSESILKSCNPLKKEIKSWFINTYGKEARKEPLPRLGALQLLHREKGFCEDMAGVPVYALRSLGIPVSQDVCVFWGTSSANHTWNVVFDNEMKAIHLDVSHTDMGEYVLPREPSKVIRQTYSKQAGTVASLYPQSKIPKGFLWNQNYLDVTSEYWPVQDLSCNLNPKNKHADIAFACVFNNKRWEPSWWGKVKNNKVAFEKMPLGVIFLPMDYNDKKFFPAGYPVAISKEGVTQELRPAIENSRSVTLKEQEKFLIYRPGKKYTLYYWNNNWIKLGEKIASVTSKELVFEKVPENALLLLVPEYSQRKERPFTITKSGERTWW